MDELASAISFDYAIVRVVPRVERGEFLNVGVVVFCAERSFLEARVELDRERLKYFAPWLEAEFVEEHLATIPTIARGGRAAGRIGELRQRERFHWLVAPRSTIIQLSPSHCGVLLEGESPEQVLERLLERLVRPAR